MPTYGKTIEELYTEELENLEWSSLMQHAELFGNTWDTLCVEVCAQCNQYAHQMPCKKANDVQPVPMHKWIPFIKPDSMEGNEAFNRLRRGITHEDPTGAKVHMGQKLLDHLKAGGHLDRVRELPLMEALIKNPHEIWERENGGRTYIAAYLDGNKKYAIAFSTDDATLEINTFYADSKQSGGKRRGSLIYARR